MQMSEVMRALNPQVQAANSDVGNTHDDNEMAATEGNIRESNADNSPGYLQPLIHNADNSNHNYLVPITASDTLERNVVFDADNYLPLHRSAAGVQSHVEYGPATDVATDPNSVENACTDFSLHDNNSENPHACLSTEEDKTARSSYYHLNLRRAIAENDDYTKLDSLNRNVTVSENY